MKVCKFLNEIQFVINRITSCHTRLWDQDGYVEKYFIKADENTTPEVFNSFFDLRKKYKQMYKDGQIPDFCHNCYYYTPEEAPDGEDSLIFTSLYLAYRETCRCKCIYCCIAGENNTDEDFVRMNEKPHYDIKPMFEYMDENHLINNNTTIFFAAGDLAEYPEESHFLIDIGVKNSCRFNILTHGIIYDEYVANLLKNHNADVVVSLDSGSNEMYRRIKRVNAFDRVKENLLKYSEAGKDNPRSRLMLKYILCPEINDDKEEIKKFKKIAEEINDDDVILSIDRYWLEHNIDKPVPDRLKEAVIYFLSKTDFPSVRAGIDYGFVNKDWADKIFSNNEKKDNETFFKNNEKR